MCVLVLVVVACAPSQVVQNRLNFGQYYFVPNDTPRQLLLRRLNSLAGNHLVIVRYRANHDVFDEWVYNEADIDHAKVVWARDMGDKEEEKLLRYFADRHVWLVQPDFDPARVSPYR